MRKDSGKEPVKNLSVGSVFNNGTLWSPQNEIMDARKESQQDNGKKNTLLSRPKESSSLFGDKSKKAAEVPVETKSSFAPPTPPAKETVEKKAEVAPTTLTKSSFGGLFPPNTGPLNQKSTNMFQNNGIFADTSKVSSVTSAPTEKLATTAPTSTSAQDPGVKVTHIFSRPQAQDPSAKSNPKYNDIDENVFLGDDSEGEEEIEDEETDKPKPTLFPSAFPTNTFGSTPMSNIFGTKTPSTSASATGGTHLYGVVSNASTSIIAPNKAEEGKGYFLKFKSKRKIHLQCL